jgi:hypothetical protein
MHCALPPFDPPDGVLQRCLALAVVGGTRPRGDRHLSAIAWLQGFSSCSPAAFPHQWAVWWGEASRAAASAPPSASRIFVILAEAEGELSRGSTSPHGPAGRLLLQHSGEKALTDLAKGRTSATQDRSAASVVSSSVLGSLAQLALSRPPAAASCRLVLVGTGASRS